MLSNGREAIEKDGRIKLVESIERAIELANRIALSVKDFLRTSNVLKVALN
ncbi:MAG: hypothetical protein SVE93_08330 [Candidatus Thermoplasmatota archaeon]|nr:hypothetical protein [Candidatus Thermoplasmatota archaeon]